MAEGQWWAMVGALLMKFFYMIFLMMFLLKFITGLHICSKIQTVNKFIALLRYVFIRFIMIQEIKLKCITFFRTDDDCHSICFLNILESISFLCIF